MSPEYENIKSRFSSAEAVDGGQISNDNIWKNTSFPDNKVFVSVTKINSPEEISVIKGCDCGVIAEDIFGKTRIISPLGLILYESDKLTGDRFVFGADGTINWSDNDNHFQIVSRKGKRHTVRTAGVVKTAVMIPGMKECFAIGTNAKRIWIVKITDKGYSYVKKRLPGAPVAAYFMDRRLIVICTQKDCIYEWDPETGKIRITTMPDGFFEDAETTPVSDIGFLCRYPDRILVADIRGNACYINKEEPDTMTEYLTSPSGRYLGIIGIRTIESHGKTLRDGYASAIDLPTGQMVWDTEYLINNMRLLGILDDGDGIFYDPNSYAVFRMTPGNASSELLVRLPGSVDTLIRNRDCIFILCRGEIWNIRQISEMK